MWNDVDYVRPEDKQRVIVLKPFGMRVECDTYSEKYGWLNNRGEYVSHWMPLVPPGTYSEIMRRPQGPLPPVPHTEACRSLDWLAPALAEHVKMMEHLFLAQIAVRGSAEKGDQADEHRPTARTSDSVSPACDVASGGHGAS